MNWEHDQGTLHRGRRPNPAIPSFKLLHHQAITDVIQSTSAIRFRNRGSKTTKISQLLHDLLRKFGFLRIIFNDGTDLLFYIGTHGLAYQLMLFREQIVQLVIIRTLENIGFGSHNNEVGCENTQLSLKLNEQSLSFGVSVQPAKTKIFM